MIGTDLEIEAVVDRYCEAIGTQNKDEFISLWTGEPSDVLISGSKYFEGVHTITDSFLIGGIQKMYSSIRLVKEDIKIHRLTDEIAVVIFRYHTVCRRRETGEPYGIRGLETQVLKYTSSGWRIAHIQYSGKEIDPNTLEYK